MNEPSFQSNLDVTLPLLDSDFSGCEHVHFFGNTFRNDLQ